MAKEKKWKCGGKEVFVLKKCETGVQFFRRILSLPTSKTVFVEGVSERILITGNEAVTSRLVDMTVKRLRNCERKERRVGRITHGMIKNKLYK